MDLEQTAIERLKMASEMSLRLYKQPLVITYSGGPTGDCEKCPYWKTEQLTAEQKEKLGVDTWTSCDIDKVGTDAADLIERLTAENAALREKVPQWISVEERRPEPGKRVLATDGVFVGEAYRTSADTWRRYDGIAMRDCLGSIVTHWMPLPDAPEVDL